MSLKRLKKHLLIWVKRLLKDLTLWHLYPARYRRLCKRPIVPGRAVLFETKDREMRESFRLLYERLDADPDKSVRLVACEQNYVRYLEYCKNCYAALDELAQAEVIFVDDACDLVSCLPLRPETHVVQIWHACGAFKKWGMSCAEKKFGGSRADIERHPFYRNLSLVTVSSPEVAWAYVEAMDLKDRPEIVQALGVSRTDVFFDPAFHARARAKLETVFPAAQGKRVILYAPTFRGRVRQAKGPDQLDIERMRRELGGDSVLVVKHHPFVKSPAPIPPTCGDFAYLVAAPDASERVRAAEPSIDELLAVADACITDYSSIVFEYSLFLRPLVFFAYDQADYDDWRGFYYPYEEFTPGPVVTTTEEVIGYLQATERDFDSAQVAAFRDRFMCACDGHATERIIQAAFDRA